MAGPTGMGMAKLISENGGLENGNEKYSFTKYADTGAAKADLAAGKIDIICLPTNEAAVYYNTVKDDVQILAVNCLNSLYLLTSGPSMVESLKDLEGQTVYTCKNGTPRAVLTHIVESLGLDITISYEVDGKEILTPADLSALVCIGAIPNAVMPEPLVTSALLTIAKNDNPFVQYTVDVDMTDEWAKISETPVTMGCIIASDKIIASAKPSVDAFLAEYKASVDFIGNLENIDSAANYVVETGVMAAAPAAKKALKNLGDAISYLDGSEMKAALEAFYKAIGVALPDSDFYYEK
jgi:NitT/TauT family transport system substrate-binding protein